MATASGKRLNDWIRTDKAKSYLAALSAITGIAVIELLEVGEGNQPTWGHPKVSIRFAQWCSDDFAVQVDGWIDELMTTGSVSIVPKTYGEALIEAGRLALENEEIKIINSQLNEENQQLSEAVDELFSYSSIVRIAKFNKCDEKLFNWRLLKNASKNSGLEIKRVPCPRFGEKLLYPHDAWRLAYPAFNLPETTTLKIVIAQSLAI
jgi:hypothetical protein